MAAMAANAQPSKIRRLQVFAIVDIDVDAHRKVDRVQLIVCVIINILDVSDHAASVYGVSMEKHSRP